VIVFQNTGLVPLEAVRTMGVSAKEGENPIGYFGTGLKYAIAILLRSNHEVELMRGEERFKFDTRQTEIRGQRFNIVTMNGEDLGFTDQMGKNWEVWQAYRELYCNALDEGGDSFSLGPSGLVSPEEGQTKIIVRGAGIEEAHQKKSAIVLQTIPEIAQSQVEIHAGEAGVVYYRGIAAGAIRKNSIWTYNVITQCTLTEDRSIKYDWEFVDPIRLTVLQCKNRDFLRDVLTAPRGTFEGDQLKFHDMAAYTPSPEFLEVVEELERDCPNSCNTSAVDIWKRRTGRDVDYAEYELTEHEKRDFQNAMCIARRAGASPEVYDITFVESLGTGVLGMAKRSPNRIYIARKALDMGVIMLAGTLYEEWLHLARNVEDETREMQNTIIDMLMRCAQQLPPQEEVPF
jgi:hypothetical protein